MRQSLNADPVDSDDDITYSKWGCGKTKKELISYEKLGFVCV